MILLNKFKTSFYVKAIVIFPVLLLNCTATNDVKPADAYLDSDNDEKLDFGFESTQPDLEATRIEGYPTKPQIVTISESLLTEEKMALDISHHEFQLLNIPADISSFEIGFPRVFVAPYPKNNNKTAVYVGMGYLVKTYIAQDQVWENDINLKEFIPNTLNDDPIIDIQMKAVWVGTVVNKPFMLISLVVYYGDKPIGYFLRSKTPTNADGNTYAFEIVRTIDNERDPIYADRFSYVENAQEIIASGYDLMEKTAEQETGYLISSLDDGATWAIKDVQNGKLFDESGYMALPLHYYIDIPGTNEIWAATVNPCLDKGGMMLSTDKGVTWKSYFHTIPTRIIWNMFYQSDIQGLIISGKRIGHTLSEEADEAWWPINHHGVAIVKPFKKNISERIKLYAIDKELKEVQIIFCKGHSCYLLAENNLNVWGLYELDVQTDTVLKKKADIEIPSSKHIYSIRSAANNASMFFVYDPNVQTPLFIQYTLNN